jgi:hypothetical protein
MSNEEFMALVHRSLREVGIRSGRLFARRARMYKVAYWSLANDGYGISAEGAPKASYVGIEKMVIELKNRTYKHHRDVSHAAHVLEEGEEEEEWV